MVSNAKPNLSDGVRNNVAQYLLGFFNHGCVEHGAMKKAAAMFNISRRSVTTIWNQAKEQLDMGLPIHLTNRKRGMKRKARKVFDNEFFKTIPVKKRSTIRRAALALSVSTSTVWRWKKNQQMRAHTSAIRTYLSPVCKLKRLQFCLEALQVDTLVNKIKFKSMCHTVHIDEKWFYLTRTTEKYYLSQDEEDVRRSCKNKRFITKIMFLCAVTKPIYDEEGTEVFDGKIGMYPFTEQVAAKRSSVNREAGTMETKAIQSITREIIKTKIIKHVIPDIKALWPITERGDIFIQQDNARPHITDDDPEFRTVASSDGFNIHLIQQPPNSPDLNVNDLGWFRALQSIQEETAAMNVDELVAAVMGSFDSLEPMKLNFVYLTLRSCMVEILKVRGHNNYRVPHMKKATLLRQGRLPVDLEVDGTLVLECVEYMIQAGLGAQMQPVLQALQGFHV